VISIQLDLSCCQCPLCFHSVPLDGVQIIGRCPKCGQDTRLAIFRIRYPRLHFLLKLIPWGTVNISHVDEFPT
jgi:Zn finger protein HypA/HybF involved in hydrogenase expression